MSKNYIFDFLSNVFSFQICLNSRKLEYISTIMLFKQLFDIHLFLRIKETHSYMLMYTQFKYIHTHIYMGLKAIYIDTHAFTVSKYNT